MVLFEAEQKPPRKRNLFIFHQILYRPNMLRTLVTPANFFLLNFADTGSACSNMEYEQSIDNSSTNASTLSVSVFVFVCVYACLCFCPFMCVLVYLSLYVCMCLGALCTMLGLRMQSLWALSLVKQPSAENRQRLNMQDEVK